MFTSSAIDALRGVICVKHGRKSLLVPERWEFLGERALGTKGKLRSYSHYWKVLRKIQKQHHLKSSRRSPLITTSTKLPAGKKSKKILFLIHHSSFMYSFRPSRDTLKSKETTEPCLPTYRPRTAIADV